MDCVISEPGYKGTVLQKGIIGKLLFGGYFPIIPWLKNLSQN